MDANELRTLQAPLKKQYREQPATALTPARAEAMLDMDRIVCRVSWGGETDAGLYPATGGDGGLACSADMMLEALVACAGVTLSAVATAMGVSCGAGGLSRRATGTRAARWAWIAKRRSASPILR
jgi:hypothetical protein